MTEILLKAALKTIHSINFLTSTDTRLIREDSLRKCPNVHFGVLQANLHKLLSTSAFNLDNSRDSVFLLLTLYQMKNFSLVQTENIRRRQFQCGLKGESFL